MNPKWRVHVQVAKVDADSEKLLGRTYNIDSFPTIKIFSPSMYGTAVPKVCCSHRAPTCMNVFFFVFCILSSQELVDFTLLRPLNCYFMKSQTLWTLDLIVPDMCRDHNTQRIGCEEMPNAMYSSGFASVQLITCLWIEYDLYSQVSLNKVIHSVFILVLRWCSTLWIVASSGYSVYQHMEEHAVTLAYADFETCRWIHCVDYIYRQFLRPVSDV